MRLDKYISMNFSYTRSEAKKILSKGLVTVNGIIAKNGDLKIDELNDEIVCEGKSVKYKTNVYYMLNKPAGVVSATEDKVHKTVVDLLPDNVKKRVFPVGRLDIDTEGLLLITDDGDFSHRITSPNHSVIKEYFAVTSGIAKPEFNDLFKIGINLGDFVTRPAELIIKSVNLDNNQSEVIVKVTEGRFHQVKRMLASVGLEVTYLKRLSIGDLFLDDNLKPGEYRELSDIEINMF